MSEELKTLRSELKRRDRLVRAVLENVKDSIKIIEDQIDLPLGPPDDRLRREHEADDGT